MRHEADRRNTEPGGARPRRAPDAWPREVVKRRLREEPWTNLRGLAAHLERETGTRRPSASVLSKWLREEGIIWHPKPLRGFDRAELGHVVGAAEELTCRERRLLVLMLGLDGHPPRNRREVREILGLGEEGVRNEEGRAVGKILGRLGSPPQGPAARAHARVHVGKAQLPDSLAGFVDEDVVALLESAGEGALLRAMGGPEAQRRRLVARRFAADPADRTKVERLAVEIGIAPKTVARTLRTALDNLVAEVLEGTEERPDRVTPAAVPPDPGLAPAADLRRRLLCASRRRLEERPEVRPEQSALLAQDLVALASGVVPGASAARRAVVPDGLVGLSPGRLAAALEASRGVLSRRERFLLARRSGLAPGGPVWPMADVIRALGGGKYAARSAQDHAVDKLLAIVGESRQAEHADAEKRRPRGPRSGMARRAITPVLDERCEALVREVLARDPYATQTELHRLLVEELGVEVGFSAVSRWLKRVGLAQLPASLRGVERGRLAESVEDPGAELSVDERDVVVALGGLLRETKPKTVGELADETGRTRSDVEDLAVCAAQKIARRLGLRASNQGGTASRRASRTGGRGRHALFRAVPTGADRAAAMAEGAARGVFAGMKLPLSPVQIKLLEAYGAEGDLGAPLAKLDAVAASRVAGLSVLRARQEAEDALRRAEVGLRKRYANGAGDTLERVLLRAAAQRLRRRLEAEDAGDLLRRDFEALQAAFEPGPPNRPSVAAPSRPTTSKPLPGRAPLREIVAALEASVGYLSARERYVMVRRLGLWGGRPWSCIAIARHVGVKKTVVYRIKRTAEPALYALLVVPPPG